MYNRNREMIIFRKYVPKVLREGKGLALKSLTENFTLIDIESTGFSSAKDEIIEIAALKIRNLEIIDTFSIIIKPTNEIPLKIEQLTGITNSFALKEGVHLNDALNAFLEFVNDDIIVAHNASFDLNFIYDKCLKHLNYIFCNDYICTMQYAKQKIKTKSYALSKLRELLSLETPNSHRAIDDSKLTFELYTYLYSLD